MGMLDLEFVERIILVEIESENVLVLILREPLSPVEISLISDNLSAMLYLFFLIYTICVSVLSFEMYQYSV